MSDICTAFFKEINTHIIFIHLYKFTFYAKTLVNFAYFYITYIFKRVNFIFTKKLSY